MLGVAAIVEVCEAPARHHGLAVRVLVLAPARPGETRRLDVGPLGQVHLLRQHQHADVVLVLCCETSDDKKSAKIQDVDVFVVNSLIVWMVDDLCHLDDQSLVLSPVPGGDVSEAQPHPELPRRGDGGGAVSSGDHVTGRHKAATANLRSMGLSSETALNLIKDETSM